MRQQLTFSFLGIVTLALLVGLAIALQSPEKLAVFNTLEFFEENRLVTFPVRTFSPAFFKYWRVSLVILTIVFSWLSLRFFRDAWLDLISGQYRYAQRKIQNLSREWQNLRWYEKWLAGITFLVITGERFYYLGRFPVHTDEAASYFLFIRPGWFAALSFYPIPNNHLLQNLLAVPLDHLFADAFWALRFWPLLFSLLLLVAGFLLLLRFSDFLVAYTTSAFFGFASLTLFFSTQGRGYILLTLLAVLAFGSLLRALQQGKAGYWLLFSFWSVLGFFTVPVFLYPFAAFAVFAVIFIAFGRKWHHILPLLLALIITAVATFLLYGPLLLVSGSQALFSNKYLQSLTIAQFYEGLPAFIAEKQMELLGLKGLAEAWIFYCLLAGQFLLLLFRKLPAVCRFLPKQTTWLLVFCLVLNLVVYGLMRIQLVLPAPRVFLFKSFFDLLGTAILLVFLLKVLFRKPRIYIPVLILILAVFVRFQALRTEFFLTDYPGPYYTYQALNQQIRASYAQNVYVEEPFYRLFLQYDYARDGMPVKIDAQQGRRTGTYDYVVLLRENPFPADIPENFYRLVYQDAFVKAYRLK